MEPVALSEGAPTGESSGTVQVPPSHEPVSDEAMAQEAATLTAELERLNRLHDLEVLRRRVTTARHRLVEEGLDVDLPSNTPNVPDVTPEASNPGAGPVTPGIGVTTPPRVTKRPKLDDDQVDVPRPGRYKGESRKELVEWLRTCEQLFEVKAATYSRDHTKVIMAQGFLSGAPQDSWWRRKDAGATDSITWKEFKKFLEDDLRPETLRGLDVRRLYHSARQLPGQSVHQWATYLETLEAQMPPFQENQRSEKFLFGLHKGLQDHLLETRADTSNRNHLIETAMLIDETQGRSRRSEDTPRNRRPLLRTGPASNDRQTPPGNSRLGGPSPPNNRALPDKGQAQCRYCGFKGHFERECRKKARDEAEKGENRPKALAQ